MLRVPGFGIVGAANQAVVNLVHDLDGVGRGALLGAHLHHLAIFLLRLHQHRPFGRVVAAWLLDIHMLAGLEAGDGHRSMPVVRTGDADGVHILLLQNLAKILFRRGSRPHRLLGCGSKFLEDIAVYIADVRDAGALFVRLERREVRIAAAVESDHGKVQAPVRAENLAIASGVGADCQPRCSYRKCIDKLTTIDHSSTLSFDHSVTTLYPRLAVEALFMPHGQSNLLSKELPRGQSIQG